MKKWSTLFLILFVIVFLSACGIKKDVQPIVANADKALTENKFDKAIDLYSEAYNKDNNDAIFRKMQGARKKKYDDVFSKYSALKGESKYEEALVLYNEINEKLKDIIPKEEKTKLEKDKSYLEKMIKKQKVYDDYVAWSKPYVLQLSKIGYEWMRVSQSLQLGTVTKAEAQRDLGNLILKNQNILGEVETKGFNIDAEFSETHIILLDIVTKNNTGFTSALGRLRENSPVTEISTAGQPADESKQKIASFKGSLSTLAQTMDVRDTFSEILTPEEETKSNQSTTKQPVKK